MQDDITLTENLRRGDLKALESVFRSHYRDLLAYGLALCHDPHEAEDMVQDVFFRIWEKRRQIRAGTSLKAYLVRSVRNAFLDRIKRDKVRTEYLKLLATEPASASDTAEEYAIAEDLHAAIMEAVTGMPEQRRRIFEMSRFGGLKYQEIAKALNISVKTVETQMGRALKQLRMELAEYLIVLLYIWTHYGEK
ncbi:RNA polymerase sigma-70 factor [Fulvitalea axinellae]|uniref:RNA polymerase sigma-70 factor n=1 Tax=Fulvitalea axinellae TaxID=1182444 RepID=A0AAU9CS93_9BACT|nr:RNA polymerase sigma-70 factor [Fulvitalea axinellae]